MLPNYNQRYIGLGRLQRDNMCNKVHSADTIVVEMHDGVTTTRIVTGGIGIGYLFKPGKTRRALQAS